MNSLKNVLIFLKHASKKIRASATAVIGGLLLTSCCSQKELVSQERITIVPTHKIDTCFVIKSDTVLSFETDTLRVEAIVKGTLFKFRVETKPLIVRDTTITKKEEGKAKKKEEKAKKNSKKQRLFYFFSLCFLVFLLTIRFKK